MNAQMLINTYHSLANGHNPFPIPDVITTFADVDDVYMGGIIESAERDLEI